MDVTRRPEVPSNSPVPKKNRKRVTVQRSTSLSHGGELSGVKGHCRVLRSSSANTASTIPESKIKKPTIRTGPDMGQLDPLLSRGLSGLSQAPHHQLSGSIAYTSSRRGSECQNRSQHHTKHIRRHIPQTSYRSKILSRSDAHAVLVQESQSATLVTEHLRRTPAFMDFILDLQSTVPDEEDDPPIEGMHRPRTRFTEYHEYTFTDERSLLVYWADQATLWRGMRMIDLDAATATRFPDSDERSTASWDPSLNGSQSGD